MNTHLRVTLVQADLVVLPEMFSTETAVLDLESLRSYRKRFPVHLDADRFELVG